MPDNERRASTRRRQAEARRYPIATHPGVRSPSLPIIKGSIDPSCPAHGNPVNRDIFISHSSRDKPAADAVCAALERAGLRCWIAPRDIVPGTDWSAAIVDGLM